MEVIVNEETNIVYTVFRLETKTWEKEDIKIRRERGKD